MTYNAVSIVLPIHNQADHIAGVIDDYQAALAAAGYRHELVLVTNGCTDDSPRICREAEARYESVKTVDSELPGWGRAVKLGLAHASGDLLCFTNSARTSANDMMTMLNKAFAHLGVVIKANRIVRENWKRRLGSSLYNLECKMLLGLKYRDVNGTPKIFPRSCEKLLALTRDDDLIDAEFGMICARANYQVIEVPIASVRRRSGSSTTNYRSALKMYWGALQLRRAYRG